MYRFPSFIYVVVIVALTGLFEMAVQNPANDHFNEFICLFWTSTIIFVSGFKYPQDRGWRLFYSFPRLFTFGSRLVPLVNNKMSI